ncbi:MAG: tetratricopeptide repeat protein [Planctomycetaceae bacterium]|nr:tetratricopeptide repeat protein [Planctomycetaceae bacterium]
MVERTQQPTHGRTISAVKRVRLEEAFKRAGKKAVTPQDFDFAADLLAQCVIGDPGNPVYVRAYLENLHKKFQNHKKNNQAGWFARRSVDGALKKALAQRLWDEAIRHGLEALRKDPWDVPTLTAMATAAKQSGDRDSALCYLKAALTKSPKDPTCNRMAAIVLDEMGLVNQAIVFWQRVLEMLPKDQEASEAVTAFQIGAKSANGTCPPPLTAQEREEIARQLKLQQEEMARQQKLREELLRQQETPEEADFGLASTDSAIEQDSTSQGNDRDETAKTFREADDAEFTFGEDFAYGIDFSEMPKEREKIQPWWWVGFGVIWVLAFGVVILQWGPSIWARVGWPWWAWIVLGVFLLVAAFGLHTRQRTTPRK